MDYGVHLEWTLGSIWNGLWGPFGMDSGVHLEWTMGSIWNGLLGSFVLFLTA
jgi:hypothetical protein